MLKKVEKKGIEGIKAKRKPYKIGPDDFFQKRVAVREVFSGIIDNPDPHRIAIIPSVSYGMANVVKNLPKKSGEIVVLGEQFPSNIYPWMSEEGYKLKFVEEQKGDGRGQRWNERILDAINENTAAVAMAHVHWADGTLFDLVSIRQKCSEHGAALVIDGTQSVGALPFSVQEIRPDALVCAGYKWLMGPYSLGTAYYGPMFDNGVPVENNWIARKNSEDFTGLVNYEESYQSGALRFDVGEHSNFILLPMLAEALKQVKKWTPESIQAYARDLMRDAVAEIRDMGFWIEQDSFRSHHLFGIRLPESIKQEKLQQQLKQHKVSVSFRGDAIRVSPHVYNDQKDVNKLLQALKSSL
jgi:selenocysteine lyase/cysteine desulfurase